MKEENIDDTLTEEDYSYEDSVQFYINDIETWRNKMLNHLVLNGAVITSKKCH